MATFLSRRSFAAGGAAILAGSACAASGRRVVNTPLGPVELPSEPRRVVAIDSRISLEMALALDLPLIGYSHSRARPWVPVPASVPFLAAPPDLEQILTLQPDLILCPDTSAYSEWWPLARLSRIAPVLPSNHRTHWRGNLDSLAGWLQRTEAAGRTTAAYAEQIAGLRQRHDGVLRRSLLAAATYDPLKRRLVVRSDGTGYGFVMPAQVLADLGGRAVKAGRLGPYGEVALESLGDVLGQVDGVLLIDLGDRAPAALAREPLWQRLPAVRAGHVHVSPGNSIFGSVYTAHHLAGAWDALLTRMAS
ncbi:ABC transporter substrate-binding protein [Bosea robiniae]|uniref:ABC-type Fe3+-hydroxamate transport system, substrate-binding protein n=1 Tax=Bosea robiniae TaxID=1036780 RepID=A0ABY0P783_9HYPH|nr:ABC transporter substrate-binding protein [Bosea robiniae]SDH50291.1 ABC-type Fe3+-hydroxamate transport system, substrate-binding protein [Bosea robiniae]